MLKLLGKLGKGLATIIGLTGAAGGAALTIKADPDVLKHLEAILSSIPAIITAVGALLAAFGIGRKAGATLAE